MVRVRVSLASSCVSNGSRILEGPAQRGTFPSVNILASPFETRLSAVPAAAC
jgi:hypothetical protein